MDAHPLDELERERASLLTYLDSPKFSQASTNSTRLVAKLKLAIQKQELYEAHQILRTVYFRFANHREKLAALLDLLNHGALYLLANQEFISGQDIATLVLEIGAKCLEVKLEDGGLEAKTDLVNSSMKSHRTRETIDLDICRKISQLAIRLPNNELGQTKFIAETLKILNPKLLNRDLLHNVIACEFVAQKDYANARYHYLHCANLENAQDIASMLVDYYTERANSSELDLFITQFILQLLCLQCPLDPPNTTQTYRKPNTVTPPNATISRKSRSTIKAIAEKVFTSYAIRHRGLRYVGIPFTSLPLLNFTFFIISLIDSSLSEAITFQILCDIYKVAWSRDPNYQSYLNRIGSIYFGIVDRSKQQQQQQGGFFNNILMSLLDGTDDGDDESNHGGNNLSSCDELD